MAVGSMPAEATATAVLCQNFNDLLDCLNALLKYGNVQLWTAISSRSCHLGKLDTLANWLKTIQVIDPITGKDVSNRFHCFSG